MTALLILLAGLFVSQSSQPATEQPQYDDKPEFVVSGVTDYTYRGGHGSDTVLRSSEALSEATKSLKRDAASADSAAEQAHARAEADEKRGDSLNAVREYERAAMLEASERNLFDWGTELLTHRAPAAAITVFTKGNRLFPDSVRMLLGLGSAFYMRGEYDRAAECFYKASDLRPGDAEPYLFLGRMQADSVIKSKEYLEKLRRFAKLAPNNAWANYYYADCLWKQRTTVVDATVTRQIRELVNRAISLDDKLAPGYLLLGMLDTEQKDGQKAIAEYHQATAADPAWPEPHYRLSQVYTQLGDPAQAQREMETFKQLSADAAREAESERKQVRQFVVK